MALRWSIFSHRTKHAKLRGRLAGSPAGGSPMSRGTASGSALPGCPYVLRADAGPAAWAALLVGWRLQAPQREKRAHPDGLRGSVEPALPGRNFSSQPRESFLPLGVRPGGGVRQGGGGPSYPAPPPRPPTGQLGPVSQTSPGASGTIGDQATWKSNELRGDTTLRPRKHTRPHTAALRAPGSGSHPHHAPRASAELRRQTYLSWGSLL